MKLIIIKLCVQQPPPPPPNSTARKKEKNHVLSLSPHMYVHHLHHQTQKGPAICEL